MSSFREYLRSFATGNGSEVVFPWFPEADKNSRESRMIRLTRVEPGGPKWISYPLAFILWTGLSLVAAIKTCWKKGKDTKKDTGLARWRQFLQMLHLAWVKNLSPLDYYECRLYLDEYRLQAEHYIPKYRQGRLFRKLNEGRPTERLDHKLQAYHSLRAAGLPTVDIVDIFYADGSREFSRTDDELDKYIGQDFFVKPVNMLEGINSSRWLYDVEAEQYSDGIITVPANEIWAFLTREAKELGRENPEKQARLVQPLLRNHPDLEPLSRYSLNTLRINMVCFTDGRLEIVHAGLRMGYGNSVDDTSAIVSANVDLQTGCMLHGQANRFLPGKELPNHPTTGAQIEGRKIPCWEEVLELVKRAHKAFPENPMIGWDIAVTPDGPIIVEANCNPGEAARLVRDKQPLTKGLYAELYWDWMGEE